MVAALYVQRGGAYFGLPDVDPWDEERDARLYPGPHPVVAHPPCSCCGTPLLDRPLRRPVRDIRLAWGDCYVLCARCEATP